jgi:hypothetical protein
VRSQHLFDRSNGSHLNFEAVEARIDEPYTCENLSNIPHSCLSKWVTALEVDFVHENPGVSSVTLTMLETGTVDAIAICYDLHLSSNISVSSANRLRSGWDHGIYFLDSPLHVQAGQEICFDVRVLDDQLAFELSSNVDQMACQDVPAAAKAAVVSFSVGEMDMARLNDRDWNEANRTAIHSIIKANTGHVLCLADRWDLCSLLAASEIQRRDAEVDKAISGQVALCCSNMPDEHAAALRAVASTNGFAECIELHDDSLLTLVNQCQDDDGERDRGLFSSEPRFDVCIVDLVEGTGLLRPGALEVWASHAHTSGRNLILAVYLGFPAGSGPVPTARSNSNAQGS